MFRKVRKKASLNPEVYGHEPDVAPLSVSDKLDLIIKRLDNLESSSGELSQELEKVSDNSKSLASSLMLELENLKNFFLDKELTTKIYAITGLVAWIYIFGPLVFEIKNLSMVALEKKEEHGLVNIITDLNPFAPRNAFVELGEYRAYVGQHFLDSSPPGTYDFTIGKPRLKSNGVKAHFEVPIPAPCDGVIRRTWFQGRNGNLRTGKGAGQIVELDCAGKPYYWLMGHLVQGSPPKAGTRVKKGQVIGVQGITGRTSGYHIHAQIHRKSNGARITNRSFTRPIVEAYINWLNREI
jgi:murein DD-endopeptidase MepM/ murein hydrolase activator NlpD